MFAAISFTGCSNNVSAFDSCEVENAARSSYANRVTLYSNLTPSYGEDAYFVHDVKPEATRGRYAESYSQDYSPSISNVWLYTKFFKYSIYGDIEVYVGDYDLGSTVMPAFKNLQWESGENHKYNM